MTRLAEHVSPLVADAILHRMREGEMTLGEVLDEAIDLVLAHQLNRTRREPPPQQMARG